MVKFGTVSAVLCFVLLITGAMARAADLEQRWVYLQLNLQVEANVDRAIDIAERAAKAGYNGIVYADFKLNVLDRVPDWYFKNLAKFKQTADRLGLEIIPCVAPFGYSDGLLIHDPNLAEGLPARDVPLVVKNQKAASSVGRIEEVRGDFEEARGDTFAEWSFQDEPGKGTWRDTNIKHGGAASLRIENPAGTSGNRRVNKRLKVRPWTQFHAAVWIKTEDFAANSATRLFAIGKDGRVLAHQNLGVKQTQDWIQHHVVFNSLENEEIQFYCGVWDARGGKLWMDDLHLEEAPLVNLVRRDECPLVLKTHDGRVLVEGRDYAPVADETMLRRMREGQFEVFHEPPVITLKPEAKVKDGDVLRISYFHTVSIYDGQVGASLTDDKSFELVKAQVTAVEKLLQPRRYFLSHDEIRVANWSIPGRETVNHAGAVLAKNVERCRQLVHAVSPAAKMCIWSDMFDPTHNAHAKDDFYLVNGPLTGSWEGLGKDMLVINWNSGKPARSTKFFADRGHSQVLAGYYDANPARIKDWLRASRENRVTGVMYTTWQNNFEHLEAFATAAWGDSK